MRCTRRRATRAHVQARARLYVTVLFCGVSFIYESSITLYSEKRKHSRTSRLPRKWSEQGPNHEGCHHCQLSDNVTKSKTKPLGGGAWMQSVCI